MNMIYGVKDKPKFSQTLIFAIQQLLAIMAATLVVPVITNAATGSTLSPAAALFGAGIGTLVYLCSQNSAVRSSSAAPSPSSAAWRQPSRAACPCHLAMSA